MKSHKLIYILAITMVLSSMSATMFNIVLPKMSEEFQLSYAEVSWVSAIYLLIYAIGSAVYGKLADLIKIKSLVTFGLLLFSLGSIVGLASQAYWMVLVGRVLQALGAAVIPAMAMIIPVRYIPQERRGRALGITATGLALGQALGPVVAALLVSIAHWRWLFGLPLLLLFLLPLLRRYLGNEQVRGGRLDWLGGGLLAGAVACLLLTVTFEMWLIGVCGVLVLMLFIWRIRRAASPFVDPRLFLNKRYTIGLLIAVASISVGYALPFLTPQLLAEVHGLSPGLIGFAMVPGAAVSAILGRRAGGIADKRGNPTLFNLAVSLLFVCFLSLSIFGGVSPILLSLLLVFGNVGQMFMQIAISNTVSRTLPKDQTGIGMGLLAMMNFLTGAVATNVYGKLVDQEAVGSLYAGFVSVEYALYSNLYIALSVIVIGIWFLHRVQLTSPVRLTQ